LDFKKKKCHQTPHQTGLDGNVYRCKAQLVVKGCTKIYGQDYTNNFYLVAQMKFIQLLFSITTIHHCTMLQLELKKCISTWWS